MSKAEKAERAEAIEKIREWFPAGSTVYTILRHVSRSGMQRSISVLVNDPEGPWDASGLVAKALGMTWDRDRGGIKIGGCGMDMGFSLVYDLGMTLFPNGVPCTGEGCQSNDHSNGDRDYTAGKLHRDGGYAFRHRWL